MGVLHLAPKCKLVWELLTQSLLRGSRKLKKVKHYTTPNLKQNDKNALDQDWWCLKFYFSKKNRMSSEDKMLRKCMQSGKREP